MAIKRSALVLSTLISLSTQALYYNEALSLNALFYSGAAYCAYETIDTWNCGIACQRGGALKDVVRINNGDKNTFAYAGFDGK